MKKELSILLLASLLVSCNVVIEDTNKETSIKEDITGYPISIIEKESETESSSIDTREFEDFIDLSSFSIEVDESFYIPEAKLYEDLHITIDNQDIAIYNDNYIIGKKVGNTKLTFEMNNIYQEINIEVVEKASLPNPTNFYDIHRLYGKKLISLGDSVTANATIANKDVYANYFARNYNMDFVNNYAIGGTTLTYMYIGSNIYKEYSTNTTAIDGCRVTKKAYTNKELNDIDYAFIAYGHNDQYFQPPIEHENDDNYNVNSFDSCQSFKGSFKYIINTLRLANPSIRIIVLNCTYSEYDKNYISPYGKTYNYLDYRNATKDIANSYNCKLIDPWDYTKNYYDYGKGSYYYQDYVHLSANGHKVLSEYIIGLF